MTKKLLGIDLGGTTIKFGILTLEGEVQEKWAIDTNILEDGKHIVPDIVGSIKHRLNLYGLTKDDFVGIGMGSPGAVDRAKKTVTGAFNLNWAHTEEVGSVIERELGIPFAIDNDANVAGLAEALLGAGKDYPTCYYVTISTGIGGAFIVDGKLVSGGRGHAGEIGNIIVKNNGYKFGGLNPGAAEGETSGTAITRKGKELLGEDRVNHAGDVFRLASEGDLKAQSIVDECISELATMFANIAHTVDPHCFVIGGGVMKSREYFYDRLVEQFNSKIHVGMRGYIPLLGTKLEDCGAIGAAMLPMSRLG